MDTGLWALSTGAPALVTQVTMWEGREELIVTSIYQSPLCDRPDPRYAWVPQRVRPSFRRAA
jgi:hypothetical protein